MALGAQEVFGADLGLAVTGIAGPSGGSPEKPVGTVYIALATPEEVEVWHYLFHGNREAIKILSAQTALDRLRRKLKIAVSVSISSIRTVYGWALLDHFLRKVLIGGTGVPPGASAKQPLAGETAFAAH